MKQKARFTFRPSSEPKEFDYFSPCGKGDSKAEHFSRIPALVLSEFGGGNPEKLRSRAIHEACEAGEKGRAAGKISVFVNCKAMFRFLFSVGGKFFVAEMKAPGNYDVGNEKYRRGV